jgi:hypothetical protein
MIVLSVDAAGPVRLSHAFISDRGVPSIKLQLPLMGRVQISGRHTKLLLQLIENLAGLCLTAHY